MNASPPPEAAPTSKPSAETEVGYYSGVSVPSPRLAVWTVVALLLVSAAGGLWVVREEQVALRAKVDEQLRLTAQSKSAGIAAWRDERLADGLAASKLPFLAETIASIAADPAVQATDAYFEALRAAYAYRAIFLLDVDCRSVRTYPASDRWSHYMDEREKSSLRQQAGAALSELHSDGKSGFELDVRVPVRSADGSFAGAIVLTVDPTRQLLPLIESWPDKSETAESLLVRPDGEAVVYLSPAALAGRGLGEIRVAADSSALAAYAMKEGLGGVMEGLNYRGVPVIAAVERIPHSRWLVVCQVDRSEAYAAVGTRAALIAGGWGLLAALIVVAGRAWWHQRLGEHVHVRLDLERARRASSERLAAVMRHANDVILLFDEEMRIVESNERAREVYSRTPEEMRRMTAADLRAEQARQEVKGNFQQALSDNGLRFETVHVRKDGTEFPVEVSSRPVEIGGRRHVLSIVRDISERQRLLNEVKSQEARFRFVVDHAPVGISLSTVNGVELVNAEHARITGVPESERHDPQAYARASHPGDYARQMAAAEKFVRGEVDHYTVEKRYVHADGTVQWAELTSRVQIDPITGARKSVTTLVDIGQRKRHEEEVERLSRLYRVISQINQTLVRANCREELFGEVCRVLVEDGGFCIAWVGWFNPQTRFIDPVAVAGDTTGYTDGIRIAADAALPEGRGPSGTAFRENRIHVANDFLADPHTVPWREAALRAGFNATIALPLQQEGEVLGLLTVYSAEKDFFNSREIELLKETAGDISFALGIFAREQRRHAAEAALQTSEARLQFLMSSTPAIIYSLRAGSDFATTFLSPNIRDVLGYEPADVIADPGFWPAHLHPEDAAAAVALIAGLETKSAIAREYRFRHADGSWRWMHDEMRITRDAQGRATELVGYWFDITERREAEEALKEREEVFSTLVGQAYDAIGLVEAETGRIAEFNRAAHEMLGYTREEYEGFSLADIEAALVPEEIRVRLGAMLKEGGAMFETLHRHKDGRLIDVRVSARLILIRGRSYLSGIWRDISAEKRAEAEVRKLSRAIEQSPAAVVITDLTGAIEYVNPRFEALTGYTLADVKGKNPRVLKSGLTPDAVFAELWRTISAGGVWRGEIINRKRNGEVFTELAIITPVKDGAGRATHYVALKEDITERKRTEADLRKLSRIIEQAPLSIAITDLQGSLEYVNPAFLENTGYRRDEVLGQNPRVLKSGLTPPEVYAEMWRTLTAGQVWRGELQNKRKDGSTYVERAVIAPVSNESGAPTHYVALKDDITERKRTEEALRETRERYELIAKNTSDAIWIADLRRSVLSYVSPSAERMLGISTREMVEHPITTALTPESVALVRRALPERVARFNQGDRSAQYHTVQLEYVRPDGTLLQGEVVTTLLAGPDGKAAHMLGVTRDVTARVQAEDALREREQRFRELFELETDAILVYEVESGLIVQANPAAARAYASSVEQLLAMRTDQISAEPEATVRLRRELLEREDDSRTVPLRWHRRADGTRFPVEISQRIFLRGGKKLAVAVIRDVTVQHEARERLQRFNAELEEKVHLRTEELLARNREIQALLESIPDMVLRFRRDGLLLNCQQAKGDTLLASLILCRAEGDTSPETAALCAAALLIGARALAAGATVADEIRIAHGSDALTLEMRAATIGAEEFVVFVRDITARRRLEDALQVSQERLSLAARAGRIGIWDYDVVNEGLVWDDQMFRLYGVSPQEFSGAYEAWQNGLHPEDRERGHEEIQLALKGEREFDTEFRIVWPNGSVRHIRAMGLVQRDAEGRPQHMVGTNWDITDEKEAAAALRRSESILQQMFQATPMGFLLVDNRTDAIVHFNQRFCEIWGIAHLAGAMRRGELKNNDIIPHCLPVLVDVPAFAASCAGLQDESNRVTLEDEIAFKEGRTVRRFTTQIRDADDRYYGRFYIFEDVTAQKRLEREIAANLEKERQISEMKTRFISVTSHEFRTPMAAAMGSVDLLANHLEKLAPAKRQELLGRIAGSLHRMTDMLDEVLLLNRMDANRVEVNLGHVNLRHLVHNLVEELRLADRDAHRLEFAAEGEMEHFVTDTNLLHHIGSNLLSNAARYSPAGSTVWVRLAAARGGVTLSVRDEGIGIPEADRARIFEPFERGSNVGNIKGTGLGLNIVKRMAGMLGGSVAVEPAEPKGSCFILSLPVLELPPTPP